MDSRGNGNGNRETGNGNQDHDPDVARYREAAEPVWTSLSGASTTCTACGSRTCNSPQPVADHEAHALGPASPRRTAHISSTQTALKERRRGRLTSVWPWVGDIRPSPTLRGDR
jgi:hypothetical protein